MTMMNDEAPSSPRSAALYYWGGNCNDNNARANNNCEKNSFNEEDVPHDADDDDDKEEERFYWNQVPFSPSLPKSSWADNHDNVNVNGVDEYNEDARAKKDGHDDSDSRSSFWNTASTRQRREVVSSHHYRRRHGSNSSSSSGRFRRMHFHLPIDDEDDDSHWLVSPRSLGASSSALTPPLSTSITLTPDKSLLEDNQLNNNDDDDDRHVLDGDHVGEDSSIRPTKSTIDSNHCPKDDFAPPLLSYATSSTTTTAAVAVATVEEHPILLQLPPHTNDNNNRNILIGANNPVKTNTSIDDTHSIIKTTNNTSNNDNNTLNTTNTISNTNINTNTISNNNNNKLDFTTLPIIDLSLPPLTYSTQIDKACRSSGFFYVINHGIEEDVLESVFDASASFFGLEFEEKMRVGGGVHDDDDGDDDGGGDGDDGKKKKGYRGYFGIGMEDLENKDGTRDLTAEESSSRCNNNNSNNNNNNGAATLKSKRQELKGDYKEGFDCGLESITTTTTTSNSSSGNSTTIANDNDDDECIKFFGKNYWPNEQNSSIQGFRNTLLNYQKELLGLADKLLVAFAKSLNDEYGDGDGGGDGGVPDDYFIVRSRNPMCTLRLLHYPPSNNSTNTANNNTNSNGCGAHTDYGLFTILLQDCIGGLQVRNRSNQWIDAPPVKGSFVINVGDMMSFWTEGKYASTVHRVISPSIHASDGGCDDNNDDGTGNARCGHRYSVPFFFNPNHDAVVKPIKSSGRNTSNEVNGKVEEEEGMGKYKMAVEILRERYEGTFQKEGRSK